MNVDNIRQQISQKKQSAPFYATSTDALGALTDFDTFPYPRWFRGVYTSDKPIIAEREAGWRPRRDNCYAVNSPHAKLPYPNHCFAGPCSVVFPCYPEYLQKFSDQKELEVILNNACTLEYR